MAGEGGRTWRTWQLAVVAAVALVVGIVAGSGTKTKTTTVSAGSSAATSAIVVSTSAPVTRPPVTAAPTTTLPPTTVPPMTVPTTTTVPGPKTTFGDGSYRVGVDIVAGTYHSSKTATDCYWKRLADFTGGLDSIIANYLSNSPTTVTILASDAGFETRGCGTWTKT